MLGKKENRPNALERAVIEIYGFEPCVRCKHAESYHTEGDDEEDGELYCHVENCQCPWFVSKRGMA